MKTGKVLFVGAGPGDPKLLTVRGVEALQQADVVVYDRLANPQLLFHAKKDARFIYCGKESSNHAIPQEEINAILVREAGQGRTVVRLKGGDPSIFGRVGEEAEECRKHSVSFEIVPGITSGIAAPLYAGIPLTHRDYNSSVAFLTGHLCEKNQGTPINWEQVSGVDTLVIYMGVKNLPQIREQLLQHGKSPSTPVALVRWGTLAEQKTLVGDLDNIVQRAADAKFTAPAIIVVGEVVRLRDRLNWFEQKPLFGKTVAYAAHPLSDDSYGRILEDLGAELWPLPVAARPASSDALQQVLRQAGQFDWIVLADSWEVRYFFHNLRELDIDIRQVKAKFVALGKQAAEELAAKGLQVEIEWPADTPLASVRKNLPLLFGDRVLLLHQAYRDGVTNDEAIGATWTKTSLYRIGLDLSHPAYDQLERIRFDWLVAADPLALEALNERAGHWADGQLICIGQETAEKARSLGRTAFWTHGKGAAFVADAILSLQED
jgi:uroporphyrinogen III methyltransferase/synthase